MRQKNYGNPWENLAIAIIALAAEDYREAHRELLVDPENLYMEFIAQEVEDFFCSGWYRKLTTVDGEMVLERLRKEAII